MDIRRRKDDDKEEEDESKSSGTPACASDETKSVRHKHVHRLNKIARTFPASCKKNPEEEQKKKDNHLYSTGPPAWTAVETHVAALQGREEGSSKREKK